MQQGQKRYIKICSIDDPFYSFTWLLACKLPEFKKQSTNGGNQLV